MVNGILNKALSFGISTLDLAEAYGDSERVLGERGVEEFQAVLKIRFDPGASAQDLVRKAQGSLTRLRLSSCHAVLIHNGDDLASAPSGIVREQLQALQESGLASRYGLSSYEPQAVLEPCQRHGFQAVQIPLNVLDQRAIEPPLLPVLARQGIEVFLRSVFLQGLLLGEAHPTRHSARMPLERCYDFRRWCQQRNISPLAACLQYALQADSEARVVVGVTTVEEVEALEAALQAKIPAPVPKVAWSPTLDPRNW